MGSPIHAAPAGGSGGDVASLAKAAQNPIASMISVPFQNNTNFDVGPENKTQNILNIQPVIPFSLNEDWNLITRTILPVISQPAFTPGGNRTNGIGDVQFSAFFSPKAPTAGGWIWGVGTIAELDTASDDQLGSGKWSLGPTAVALKASGPWVFGALINNLWDVAGSDTNGDVNKMLIQPFLNYNFPSKPGRYLTTAPIITANWEADSGEKWTLPIGGGIGQIVRVGSVPVNFQASAYYNMDKPDNAGFWQVRLQAQLLFPK
ncbi:MAG: neuromedin U [Gammaproteobacteria bacterium]|nr:neuromedin U [Gammaproteobacteria bacterium]MBQ0838869.1 neuromedin U [Gammaproteobacteria bacterium]